MNFKALTVTAVLSVFAAAACGNDGGSGSESDDESGGSNATGGLGQGGSAGATGGTGMSGSGNGPAITTAPPEWVRPADCGGIGDSCLEGGLAGCGELSVCQLEGYVCIPKLADGATSLPGRTPETPYCAAYTCMTFEEASCFCTGEAGDVTPSCSSPSALAGICTGLDGSCASRACCAGLTCLDTNGGRACKESCATAADCESGCCTDRYDTGILVCAEADACTNPCKKRGEMCNPGSSTTPNDCCRGACVQSENPDYAGCRPTCTTNEQCDTGCCVLFSNSTSGFCTDAKYCGCGAAGAACGLTDPECCEGTLCAGFSADTLSCYQTCTSDADCPGTKCNPLSDNSASICDQACAMRGAACGPELLDCCAGETCAGNATDGYTCFQSCDDPSDCPSGDCEILSDGMTGICRE